MAADPRQARRPADESEETPAAEEKSSESTETTEAAPVETPPVQGRTYNPGEMDKWARTSPNGFKYQGVSPDLQRRNVQGVESRD